MMADSSGSADCQLGIFAKYWQAGAVKTRLAADIGPEAAAAIHRECVHVLLERLAKVRCGCHVLAFSPIGSQDAFRMLAGDVWKLHSQSDGDLGVRMRAYFEQSFQSGARRVVLLGSDSPTIPIEYVEGAIELLRDFPVVLGPSEDGGYYLIGAKEVAPNIFDDIKWSTDEVWSQTVARLDQLGISFGQLPVWYDVDVLEDLRRLNLELEGSLLADKVIAPLRKVVQAALASVP